MATIKIPINPSKQPQTTPEKSLTTIPALNGPFIDYVTLTVSSKKRSLFLPHEGPETWLKEISTKIADHPQIYWKPKFAVDGVTFRVAVSIHKPSRHPRIAIDCKKPPHLRVEFNPTKLGASGLAEMCDALNYLSPNLKLACRDRGRISRLDVAVDLQPMQMQDMLALNDQTKTCRTYLNKGVLETIYFGKRKGNHTRIYDKSKEQAVKKRQISPNKVRVERVLRNTKMGIADLVEMENPFLPLKLLATIWPMPPETVEKKKYIWRLFQAAAIAEGTDVVLKWLNEEKRNSYRTYLKLNCQDWWQPEAFWGGWKQKAEELLLAFK